MRARVAIGELQPDHFEISLELPSGTTTGVSGEDPALGT
jgi:hypothetical protein